MEGETGERNAEEFSSPHEEQRSLTTMVGVHVKKPIFKEILEDERTYNLFRDFERVFLVAVKQTNELLIFSLKEIPTHSRFPPFYQKISHHKT